MPMCTVLSKLSIETTIVFKYAFICAVHEYDGTHSTNSQLADVQAARCFDFLEPRRIYLSCKNKF